MRDDIGIDYSTFEALAIGASTKYTTDFRAPIESSPLMTILFEGHLTGGVVPIEHVRSFLSEVSADLSQLEAEARKSSIFNNDFSLFRKNPFANVWISLRDSEPMLVHLLLDQDLLLKKVISSPYWAGVRKMPEGFARFWGAIFEAYMGGLLEEICRRITSSYVHSPRLPATPNDEVCDGLIVHGNTVVLLEYKSSILTAKAKYSGDHEELGREIRKKLVRDDETGSPKAVAQLANAAKQMFDTTNTLGNPWFNRSVIERCYAVVVTLDDIGGAPAISTLLNIDFQRELAGCELSCEIRPLFCLDAESLEVWSSIFEYYAVSHVLEQWFVQDPSLMKPLSSFRYEEAPVDSPAWLQQGIYELITRVTRVLIEPDGVPSYSNFQEMVAGFDNLSSDTQKGS